LRVVLVRHAEPEASPTTASHRWPLSRAGRSAALELRDRLPARDVWLASTEVKAVETLTRARTHAGIVIRQDTRFDEVSRTEAFDDDFRARRRAWVEGHLDQRHEGWETPREAAARFDAAVREQSALGSPLVIASHGMVLTAWLTHARGAVAPAVAGAFWSALALPDVIEVDLVWKMRVW
jgi:broad specificity phosphatase PhoE